MEINTASPTRAAAGTLTRPDWEQRVSFLAAMREFHADGHYLNWPLTETERDFANFLARQERAFTQPVPGYVSERCFWLVDADEVCGVLHFRHPLNQALRQFGGNVGYTIRPSRRSHGYGSRILRLGLALIWQLEPALSSVLLTCYENNPASQRIIERNGGRLENTIRLSSHTSAIRRYWIARSG